MRWIALLALVAGASCVVPGAESRQTRSEGEGVDPAKGQLVLRWKADPRDRAVLGSTWASANADAYELVLLGPSSQTVDLSGTGTQVVAVDPGTWRVLVLAGVKKTPGSSTAYLVGSAWSDAVAVAAGARTTVDLVLRSVDLGLSSGAAYWKGSVALTATGKTRNPRVGMLLAGASTTSRPRLKSTELWNGYHEVDSVTGTPDDWVAEASATVPDGGPTFLVGLVGAGLCVLDSQEAWIPTAGLTSLSWSWPSRAELTDTHSLTPFTELSVTAGPPPTGMDLSVTWE